MKKLIAVTLVSVMALVGCQSGTVSNLEAQVADLQTIIGEQEMTITDLQEQQVIVAETTELEKSGRQVDEYLVMPDHTVTIGYELVDIAEGSGPTEYYLRENGGMVLYDDDMPEGAQIGDEYTIEFDLSGEDLYDGILIVEKQ